MNLAGRSQCGLCDARRWIRRGSCAAAIFALTLGAVGCKRDAESSPISEPATKDPSAYDDLPRIRGRKGMNVVLVSVDTTRADHIGCYGHPTVKTPNIDRLAAEGVRFEYCISSAPLTLVSHSTMLTGSYQYVHGARDNGAFFLAPENRTLAEILKEQGYATHAEVATTILDAKFGLDQGFDSYGDVGTHVYTEDGLPGAPGVDLPVPEEDVGPRRAVGETQYDLERRAGDVMARGVELLREQASGDAPFFLFLHCYDPHWPRESPEPYASQYTDPYFGEIAYFDHEFGKLIDEIDRLGLAESTLLILVSDHGEGRGQHGEYTHSSFLYDTTLHVPFVMRCKGVIPPGLVIRPQVRLVDLAPTILDFIDLYNLRSGQMQGVSVLPLLANPDLDMGLRAYSDTIVPRTMYGYSPLRSLRTQDWKYILAPVPELYDLQADSLELFNLANGKSDQARMMRDQLWQIIADSPEPPGSRASSQEMDAETAQRLQALGYVSSQEEFQELGSGSELDHFEPEGENPRDHIEEIELLSEGMGALRFGKYEPAVAALKRLLDLHPTHSTALSGYATALAFLRRYSEAAEVFEKLLAQNPDRAEDWRRYGILLGALRRHADAEKAFHKALELDPDNFVVMANLANALGATGRFKEANEFLDQAAQLGPDSPVIPYYRGVIKQREGRIEEALTFFLRATEVEPAFMNAHIAAAIARRQLNRPQDALEGLEQASKILPDQRELLVQIAVTQERLGQLDEAGATYEKILAEDAKDAWLLGQYALNLMHRGKHEEALKKMHQAAELDADSSVTQYKLGGLLEACGKKEEARATFESIIEKWPTFVPAYESLSILLSSQGDTSGAIAVLEKGLKKMDNDPRLMNDVAWHLATAPEGALRDAKRALKLATKASRLAEDENPFYLDTLAAAHAENGDFEKAVETVERAIRMAENVHYDDLVEALKKRREIYHQRRAYREE